MPEPTQQPQVNIKASDEALQGKYANLMQVAHLEEEFILDFMNVYPYQGMGTLNARIIVSPGHLKRMVGALTENLRRFEAQYGEIKTASEPSGEVGFHA